MVYNGQNKMKKSFYLLLMTLLFASCNIGKNVVTKAPLPNVQNVGVDSIESRKDSVTPTTVFIALDTLQSDPSNKIVAVADSINVQQPNYNEDTIITQVVRQENIILPPIKLNEKDSILKYKYGHVDFERILVELPEYKEILLSMDSLQLYLASQYEAMSKEYKQKRWEIDNDTTSLPVVLEMKQIELQSLLERIQYFQKYAQQQLYEENNRRLSPLYQRIYAMLGEVGSELELLYIFDVKTLLSASEDSLDVTDTVISRLNNTLTKSK